MEPMNAPPAESPANLRRQTAEPLGETGNSAFEGLGLGLGFELVSGSVSDSESVFGGSNDAVAMAAAATKLFL